MRGINDHANVGPQTSVRVRGAMQPLGYRPNRAARGLVAGRSGLLGAVAVGTTQYGPASIMSSLEGAARREGYSLAVAPVINAERQGISAAVDRLLLHGVEGLIMLGPPATDAMLKHVPKLPIVVVEGPAGGRFPTVNVDQVGGSRRAVRYLLDLGHADVWHIAGPAVCREAYRRLAGWRAELTASRVTVHPHLTGDWSARSGYEAGRILAGIREVTAVFAANDQMALGLLRSLREAGRSVPGDVSVVGFDDVPEAPYLNPPLTTVRQDFDEVARQAVNSLVQRIDNGRADSMDSAAGDVEVEATLLVRASTAAPAHKEV